MGNVGWSSKPGSQDTDRTTEALHHDDGEFHSPYATRSMQGPTIVDRRLFFVTTSENKTTAAAPWTNKTKPRIGTQDKKEYSVDTLADKTLHEDNLFNVYLGESLVPFVALPPLTAALPASKKNMSMPLEHTECDRDESTQRGKKPFCEVDAEELDPRMRTRWAIMEELWTQNKGENDKKSLTQRLNYQKSLTSQLDYLAEVGDQVIRIAYTTSGRPTATLIEDNQAILDTTLYQVTCQSHNEAYYLLSIINSTAMARAVKPYWAKEIRHLHKHLWNQ